MESYGTFFCIYSDLLIRFYCMTKVLAIQQSASNSNPMNGMDTESVPFIG